MITLVLLPGMDGTGTLFSDLVSVGESKFKSLIVRYPDDPALGYANLELLVRAALPLDRSYVILGESFSGPMAVSIAASNPPGLVGLILCATFARSPRALLPLVAALLRPFPAIHVPPYIAERYLFGRFVTTPLRGKIRALRHLVSAKTLKARTEAIAAIDVSDQLRRIPVPILYLRGKEDRLVPLAACDYIVKIRPDMQVAELDAPHLLLQAVPHDAVTVIGDFVASRIGTRMDKNS